MGHDTQKLPMHTTEQIKNKFKYLKQPIQHGSLQLYCSNIAMLQIAMQHYKDIAEI